MALTSEQERALALFRQGLSTAQVAERLGLPRPTVWRWQNELPEFAVTVSGTDQGEARAPLELRDIVRIAAPIVIALLAILFFYLSY